jgi:hypothetical protein
MRWANYWVAAGITGLFAVGCDASMRGTVAAADTAAEASCDGITPPRGTLPGPVMVHDTFPNTQNGMADPDDMTADGTGHVRLAILISDGDDGQSPRKRYDTFARSGTLLTSVLETNLSLFIRVPSFPQASGFVLGTSLVPPNQMNPSVMKMYAPDGTVVREVPMHSEATIGHAFHAPGGGFRVLERSGVAPSAWLLVAYTASGDEAWAHALPGAAETVAVGVDRARWTLVLRDGTDVFGDETLAGQWFSPAGEPGQPFLALSGVDLASFHVFQLFEAVGSGLFLQQTSAFDSPTSTVWVRSFPSGEPRAEPPPLWLTLRPGMEYHMAFGGRAYAFYRVVPFAREASLRVHTISPTGRECSVADFSLPDPFGAGLATSVRIGWDGTVILLAAGPPTGCLAGKPCEATWGFWPAFYALR